MCTGNSLNTDSVADRVEYYAVKKLGSRLAGRDLHGGNGCMRASALGRERVAGSR